MLSIVIAGISAPVGEPQQLWSAYKLQFNKTYATAEEDSHRFKVFLSHQETIAARNAEEGEHGAEHGWTKFLDLTPEEFKSMYLGYVAPASWERNAWEVELPELQVGETASKDWTGTYTTPVKDQARCGSCWAFSATEQIESDAMRELGKKVTLSEQQIVSCDKRDGGCNGGNTETAYKYVMGTAGLVSEKSYPYTSGRGKTGSCISRDTRDPEISVSSYKTIKRSANADASGVEAAMAKYVGSTGPLSICVDAQSWQTYRGGVLSRCGKSLDHCVQAVGIDTSAGTWKVRNSWNTNWGENGFIRLKYGENMCGLTHDATWVSVKSATKQVEA